MKSILLALILAFPLPSLCQTLLGTTGRTFLDAQTQTDFSIGEPVVVYVSGNAANYNIGFQQPYYDVFKSTFIASKRGSQVFPNPFSGSFRFEADSEIDQYFLFNAKSREVFHKMTEGKTFAYDGSDLPLRIYQLQVVLKSREISGSLLVHQ
jgi:hypothetical protein